MSSAARPSGSRAPVSPTIVGPTRIPTPTKPTTMPTIAIPGRRSPKNRARPKIATQTGINAMIRAAIPDGIVCSPHATMPIPPPRSSAPTIALSRHSRRLGIANEPRARTTDEGQEHQPGEGEAGRRHEERRDRLDRHGDAEVGRSPDDVEDEQAEPELAAAGGPGGAGWHSRLVQVADHTPARRGEVALGASAGQAPVRPARRRRWWPLPTRAGTPCTAGSPRRLRRRASGTTPDAGP